MTDGKQFSCGCIQASRDIKKDEIVLLNLVRIECPRHFREHNPIEPFFEECDHGVVCD